MLKYREQMFNAIQGSGSAAHSFQQGTPFFEFGATLRTKGCDGVPKGVKVETWQGYRHACRVNVPTEDFFGGS